MDGSRRTGSLSLARMIRQAAMETLERRLLWCADHDEADAMAASGLDMPAGFVDSHLFPSASVQSSLVTAQANSNAYTTGEKSVLYVRVAWADSPTAEVQSLANAQSSLKAVDQYMRTNSFGLTSFKTTFTNLVVLPQTKAYYLSNGDGKLRDDALAAAKSAGTTAGQDWDTTHYNLDAVRFPDDGPGNYGGQGYVGAKGVWLKSNSSGVAAHEFGHNLGLWHSNAWAPTDPQTVIGPGSNVEYGDRFDVMGNADINNHYNDDQKNILGWIPDANVDRVIESGGTHRVYANDLAGTLDPSLPYSIRITKDADREYTLDYDQSSKLTSNRWLKNGIGVRWTPWAKSNGGTQLLDTTPGSPDGTNDAYLTIGRTFDDDVANIHITPIARGSTVNASGQTLPWMDVRVNFGDSDADQAPTASFTATSNTVGVGTSVTFTATAADADGDELAYFWDFGDKTFGDNSPTARKSWAGSGDYRVRLTVSDMKGRSASYSTIVRVGAPTLAGRISGHITDADGNPVADARVTNGLAADNANYRYAYTDADGSYTLTGLPSGTYTIGVSKSSWKFSAKGFSNPVRLTSNSSRVADVNFNGAQTLYAVSGRVLSGGQPVAGATVSDGTDSVITDSTGTYSFNLPLGTYGISATASGLIFAPDTAVLDFAGDSLDLRSVRQSTSNNGVLREWWTGIEGGRVRDLTNSAKFPNSPTGTSIITGQFKAPTNWADNYGQRLRGYYLAPATGDFSFFISSDDASQLYLSTDENPANKVKVAEVRSFTDPLVWNKEYGQKSGPIHLEAGQRYYIEALQKEGGGGDHLAVGVQLPSGARELPIASSRIQLPGTPTPAPIFARVVGHQVFYNHSDFDHNDIIADAHDDEAIAPDKSVLTVGQAATFGNITSYSRGLNGVMIDIAGLSADGTLDASDFIIRTGGGPNSGAWADGPVIQSVSLRRSAGVNGSDRVTLTWADHDAQNAQSAVANGWLQVTLQANADTQLENPDTFMVGNLIGETGAGSPTTVDAADLVRVRNGVGELADLSSTVDFDRDGVVTAADLVALRNRIGDLLSPTPAPTLRQTVFSRSMAAFVPRRNDTVEERSDDLLG